MRVYVGCGINCLVVPCLNLMDTFVCALKPVGMAQSVKRTEHRRSWLRLTNILALGKGCFNCSRPRSCYYKLLVWLANHLKVQLQIDLRSLRTRLVGLILAPLVSTLFIQESLNGIAILPQCPVYLVDLPFPIAIDDDWSWMNRTPAFLRLLAPS